MSQHEDDAGSIGDYLADLVEAGKLTDLQALAYMAGDGEARVAVQRLLEEDDR